MSADQPLGREALDAEKERLDKELLGIEECDRIQKLPLALRWSWEAPFGALSESMQEALGLICHRRFVEELVRGGGNPDDAISILHSANQLPRWNAETASQTELEMKEGEDLEAFLVDNYEELLVTPGDIAQQAIRHSGEAILTTRGYALRDAELGKLDAFAEGFRELQKMSDKLGEAAGQDDPATTGIDWRPHLLYVAHVLVNHYELESPSFDTPEGFDFGGEEGVGWLACLRAFDEKEDENTRLEREVNFLAKMYLSSRHKGRGDYLPKRTGGPKASVPLINDIIRQTGLSRVKVSDLLNRDDLPQKLG